MKRVLSILLAAMMLFTVLSLSACGSAGEGETAGETASTEEEHFVFKIGHMRAEGSPTDLDVEEFCQKVTEQTNGTIEFEIYPASSLGDYTAMIERMALGDVDMMLATIGVSLDSRMNCWTIPYLAKNWDEAREIFKDDGLIVQTMSEICLDNDFRILGTYPMYFGGIALAKEPKADITAMEDQGLKIRIPATETYEAMAATFGFMSTPLNYSDIFTSLQTGVIDGTIGGGAEGYYNEFRDLLKYYLPVNDHFELQFLCVGSSTWDKLSDNQKEVLTTCAAELEAKRWEDAETSQANYEQMLADAGITVMEFTDEELAGFAEAVRAAVEPYARQELGDELYDQIMAEVEAIA